MAWFRSLKPRPIEVQTDQGFVLHFESCGALSYCPSGAIDSKASPVANIFLPRVRRRALWSVGEVHFLAASLGRAFPDLNRINLQFSRWLSKHVCIYSKNLKTNVHDYFLEGAVRHYDSNVFAFSSGLAALNGGRYFVAEGDNELVLDRVCKTLRLREIDCGEG